MYMMQKKLIFINFGYIAKNVYAENNVRLESNEIDFSDGKNM